MFNFCLILQTSLSARLSLSTSRAKKLPKSKNPTKLAENFGRNRNSVNSPLSTPFGILNLRSKSCAKSHNKPRHRQINRRSKRSIPPKNDHLPSLSPLSAKKSNTKVAKLSDLSKSSKLQSKKPKQINKKSMFGTTYLCNKVYTYIPEYHLDYSSQNFKKKCFWLKNHRKTHKKIVTFQTFRHSVQTSFRNIC